ncbi:hypothetical protein, partial [Klebsiella quasipneumoniae]|uniref:hypothetical protein n=1 Tax=Klebsiella quasipneumoniae TaxID=1463165 RepID=UPI001B7D7A11
MTRLVRVFFIVEKDRVGSIQNHNHKNNATLLRHDDNSKQKSHSYEWLNYMILKLKFGGPCWV